jgi:hypothetical protein
MPPLLLALAVFVLTRIGFAPLPASFLEVARLIEQLGNLSFQSEGRHAA